MQENLTTAIMLLVSSDVALTDFPGDFQGPHGKSSKHLATKLTNKNSHRMRILRVTASTGAQRVVHASQAGQEGGAQQVGTRR